MKICKTLEARIIDDGTLDTVIGCESCHWIGRYNDTDLLIIRPSWNPRNGAYLECVSWEICDEDHYESQWEERAIQEENEREG